MKFFKNKHDSTKCHQMDLDLGKLVKCFLILFLPCINFLASFKFSHSLKLSEYDATV